jgi:hypothetical protein
MDSSLFVNKKSVSRLKSSDISNFEVGYIREIKYSSNRAIEYLVEINKDVNGVYFLICEPIFKFSSPFNYEQFTYNTYNNDSNYENQNINGQYKPASKVLVATYGKGDNIKGVILGCLTHESQKNGITEIDGNSYKSEFNGIETEYSMYGEYTITFKGIPTNIEKLSEPIGEDKDIPNPIYDQTIAGSYFKFTVNGSIELNDNNNQYIYVNKKNKNITLNSDGSLIYIDGKNKKIVLKSDEIGFIFKNEIHALEKFDLKATEHLKIDSPKIAIGDKNQGIELLEQIAKLVDEIAKCKPISPVGPCAPMKACSSWSGVDAIKEKIEQIKGSL